MPYVITTTTRPNYDDTFVPVVSRRAVATLDEARQAAVDAVDRGYPLGASLEDEARDRNMAAAFPDSGGTVGPLPDGTVIGVHRCAYDALACHTGYGAAHGIDPAKIIDAYNAAQD